MCIGHVDHCIVLLSLTRCETIRNGRWNEAYPCLKPRKHCKWSFMQPLHGSSKNYHRYTRIDTVKVIRKIIIMTATLIIN